MTTSTERPDLELKTGILLDADGNAVPMAGDRACCDPTAAGGTAGPPSFLKRLGNRVLGFVGILPFALAGVALFATGAGLIVAFALGLSLYALMRVFFPSRKRPAGSGQVFRSRVFVIRR